MPHNAVQAQDDHDRGIRNEERICAFEAYKVAHEEVHRLGAEALTLQLTETLRRLTELNHAHEQAREKERDFVSRESHDQTIEELKNNLATVQAFTATSLPREVFDTFVDRTFNPHVETKDRSLRELERNALPTAQYRDDQSRTEQRVKALEDFKNRALGFGFLVAVLSGAVGAFIAKIVGG